MRCWDFVLVLPLFISDSVRPPVCYFWLAFLTRLIFLKAPPFSPSFGSVCKYLKTFESFYQRWGLPPHWVCLPNVEPKALLLPHGPGPLLQETFEQILINRFIKAINIQSKCSNIRMLILEDGGEFDDLTQLCWRLERLLPKGSPRDGVPNCPKNPFKWPRKGKWWPSDSSPPPRISFIPFREQNSSTCCLGTVNHPFLDLSSCGLQKKKWGRGREGGRGPKQDFP